MTTARRDMVERYTIEKKTRKAMEVYTQAILDDEKSAPLSKRIQDAFLAGVCWERTRILKAIFPYEEL